LPQLRFAWLSHPIIEVELDSRMAKYNVLPERRAALIARWTRDDALHTLLQWLHGMIPITRK
jgi:hypothetical protein